MDAGEQGADQGMTLRWRWRELGKIKGERKRDRLRENGETER